MGLKRKGKVIVGIVIFLVLLLFLIIAMALAIMIYEDNFGSRYETYEPMKFNINQFDKLKGDRVVFTSNKGQNLVGYKYYKEDVDKKGVIVIAHGLGGGGHNSYMDIANYFASNGYYVFAYDATGNDESEGKSVQGLPQGVIDLDYAIRYVKSDNTLGKLPLMLFGHSWGGYSVCSVLNIHPDVKAVVSVSGFNSAEDMFEEEGKRIAGDSINFIIPYVKIYEYLKFGKYETYSSISGFKNSNANIMIIHSSDDDMISIENSYDIYYNKFKSDDRFKFIRLENRGHNYVCYSDKSHEEINKFNEKFTEYIKSSNLELTAELKEKYFEENFDSKIIFQLDEELMNNIIEFYNESIN